MEQGWLIVVAAAIWLIGGNLLVARHYRSRGMSGWYGLRNAAQFRPWQLRLQDWVALIVLAAVTLTLFALAIGK